MIIFAAQQHPQPMFGPQTSFHDPAIMSAKLASPILSSVPGYNIQTAVETRPIMSEGVPPSLTSQASFVTHMGQSSKPSSSHGEYRFTF